MTTLVANMDADGLVHVAEDGAPRYVLPHSAFQDLLDDMKTRKLGMYSESFKRAAHAAATANLGPLSTEHSRVEIGLLRWRNHVDRMALHAQAALIMRGRS